MKGPIRIYSKVLEPRTAHRGTGPTMSYGHGCKHSMQCVGKGELIKSSADQPPTTRGGPPQQHGGIRRFRTSFGKSLANEWPSRRRHKCATLSCSGWEGRGGNTKWEATCKGFSYKLGHARQCMRAFRHVRNITVNNWIFTRITVTQDWKPVLRSPPPHPEPVHFVPPGLLSS